MPHPEVAPRIWIEVVLLWLVLDERLIAAAGFAIHFFAGHAFILRCADPARIRT